jgi:hypothetical protein
MQFHSTPVSEPVAKHSPTNGPYWPDRSSNSTTGRRAFAQLCNPLQIPVGKC